MQTTRIHRSRFFNKVFAVFIAAAMVVAMIPWISAETAYAAASAPGGIILSDGNGFSDALGSAASGEASGSEFTITLLDDVTLDSPLAFTIADPAEKGDRVILELNGHSLKGAAGTDGSDFGKACGVNAIEVNAAEFDLEVKGPGTVTGGKGAVYLDSDYDYYTGADGGMGVCFIGYDDGSAWMPDPGVDNGRLDHGLTVTGGALIQGGDGADISGDLLMYNIRNYSGGRAITSSPKFASGAGGAGIGQKDAGVLFGATTMSFAQIVVEDGTVSGGTGGDIDMSGQAMTHFALMNSPEAAAAMQDKTLRNYGDQVDSMLELFAGDGGDGIRIGAGRKYVRIDSDAEIKGSSCGRIDFGPGKYINRIRPGESKAGDGIAVWAGDIGLTNAEVGWTGEDGWTEKTADSEDMGIYVAGTVTGGSAPDAKAVNENASAGGDGISLQGDGGRYGVNEYMYGDSERFREWGIVDIEGTVTGGNGGSAISGNGGLAGDGILENFNDDYSYYGTNYYIVNGNVTGGKGGSALTTPDGKDGQAGYAPGFSLAGAFRTGGNGVNCLHTYRKNLDLSGSGTITSGDAGSTVDRAGAYFDNTVSEPVHLPSSEYAIENYNNKVSVNTVEGRAAEIIPVDTVDVTAEMTGFKDYPTTSTQLSCKVDTPDGYTGDVLVKWLVELNGEEYCDIEPTGLDLTKVTLNDNDSYKYLAYKSFEGDYSFTYNEFCATTDRIREAISSNNTYAEIFCYVLLEDGSWGKSNVMHFTRDGWDDGTGGDDPPEETPAQKVTRLINGLPSPLTLDDADAVAEAKAAYDALTDADKAELGDYMYDALGEMLSAAETRIETLRAEAAADQQKADEVEALINALPDPSALDKNDPDYETQLNDAKAQIQAAVDAFNALTDKQKLLVDPGLLQALNDAKDQINSLIPDDPVDDPVDPVGPAPVDPKPADGGKNTVKKITPSVTLSPAEFIYNGKVKAPGVVVKDGNTVIPSGQYTVKYAGARKAIGTYDVTVTLKGKYRGTGKASFNILPKKAKLSKVRYSKKTCTVRWKKMKSKMLVASGKKARIAGYRIQYSTDKTFTKGSKTVKVKGYKKTSKVIKKLKSKKTYYFRIQTYIKSGGKTYYSPWSKAKKAKIK